MIFLISPWASYKSEDIPNLNPQNIDEVRGCLGGIISFCISSLIFAIIMYFTYKLKSNDIIDMDIMMLLFIVNIIIYVALIFTFMNLSFKITDKINKNMTQKEKAKAYDEAIRKAKKYYDANTNDGYRSIFEDIFSEFAESEDERIRKRLIFDFRVLGKTEWGGLEVKDILAWLEKQGEHANFRNKIQIGDKVTRNEDGVLVNLSQLNRVAKKDEKQSEQKTVDEIAKEVCKNKESAVTFLKSAGIMNEKGELAEQYRQGEQKS